MRHSLFNRFGIKDTLRENALSNKTQALTKSMGIRVVVTLNQLFVRGYFTEIKFSKIQSS